jgi:hypothetical protein
VSAGAAQEADALVEGLFEEARDRIPESIRPVLEMQPESVGIYEIAHRD